MTDEKEIDVSLTESALMTDPGIHSTPVSNVSDKSNDEATKLLQMLLEQNVSLRGELKQLDKRLSAIEEKIVKHISAQSNQMMDNLSQQVVKQINELKENIYAKCNENKDVKLDQVMDTKVGDVVSESNMNNNNDDGNIIEKVVSEKYILNSSCLLYTSRCV